MKDGESINLTTDFFNAEEEFKLTSNQQNLATKPKPKRDSILTSSNILQYKNTVPTLKLLSTYSSSSADSL